VKSLRICCQAHCHLFSEALNYSPEAPRALPGGPLNVSGRMARLTNELGRGASRLLRSKKASHRVTLSPWPCQGRRGRGRSASVSSLEALELAKLGTGFPVHCRREASVSLRRYWLAALFVAGILAGLYAGFGWHSGATEPSTPSSDEAPQPSPCRPATAASSKELRRSPSPPPADSPGVIAPDSPHGPKWAGGPFPLDLEGVEAAWMLTAFDIQDCVTHWGQFQGEVVNGILDIRFSVAANEDDGGSLTHVWAVDGGVGDAFLQGCIVSAFRQVPFQTPKDGTVDLDLPLQFIGPSHAQWPDGGEVAAFVPPNSLGVIVFSFEAPDGGWPVPRP
jgi:hypothetical protein